MSLEAWQSEFAALLSGTRPSERFVARVHPAGALSATDALELYRRMGQVRFEEALRLDFPLTHRWLGEDAFLALSRRCIQERPSRHPSLDAYGARFVRFLEQGAVDTLEGDDDGEKLAIAAQVARLEWSRSEAQLAPDSQVLTPSDFAAALQTNFAESVVLFAPSVRVCRFTHAITPLLSALDGEGPLPEVEAREESVLVWRKGFDVFHVAISEPEADALERALRGAPLAGVCVVFGEGPEAIRAAFTALSSWAVEGLLFHVAPSGDEA